MKASITVLLLMLIGVLLANAAQAEGLISDVDREILENVQNKIERSGVSSVKDSELRKATNICQEKCTVCFDGESCNFDCVKKACMGSQRRSIDVR